MMDRILLAGFGGQGVMFIGKVLAYAGMMGGREVCWIPSYGPEMRGGTANCSVLIEQADCGIVLNQPSYEKFMGRIKPGGVLVVNGSIINTGHRRDDIDTIVIPAGDMANELGNPNLANMICLGALLPKLTLIDKETVRQAMDSIVGPKKPEMYEVNMAAIHKGMAR